MKLLSFDQSSKITGISCFINGEWQWSNIIDKHKNTNTDARFDEMVLSMYEVIEKEKPNIVVIEQVALQSNAKTMMLLARLQGAAVGKCVEIGLQYKIIEPSHWRKIVGIHQGKKKRDDLKKESMELAHKWFDESLSEDASESALLGVSYLIENGYTTIEYLDDAHLWD